MTPYKKKESYFGACGSSCPVVDIWQGFSMQADVEITRTFPRKAFFGTAGNTGVCTGFSPPPVSSDLPYRYSRTTEDAWPAANAYAFSCPRTKESRVYFYCSRGYALPGAPLKPLSSNGPPPLMKWRVLLHLPLQR